MTMAIVTTQEIPGERFRAMFGAPDAGIRYRYELPVKIAIFYLQMGLYGAERAQH